MRSSHSPNGQIERRLGAAFVLTIVFMAIEAVGGWFAGSLALMADAGHMLTDALALALAFAGFWFGRRPPDQRRSYGYRRFEVLAAWINGLLLSGIALLIMGEAALRLLAPVAVKALPMLSIATAGLGVNLVTLWWLRQEPSNHINLRGAIFHVIGDVLGSAAAMLAAIVILATGWMPIDPLLSLVIALLILRSAFALVRGATHILLEGTPDDIDLERMREDVANSVPEITGIHHIHAWSLTSGHPMLTLHVQLAEGADRDTALHAIKERLATAFHISHSVVQLECGLCPDAKTSLRNHAGAAILVAAALLTGSAAADERPVTVFAAASLNGALDAVSVAYAESGGGKAIASYAASSALARQIENGAPADIFISANEEWMDYVQTRGLVETGSRADLLRNRLVLIAPLGKPLDIAIGPGFPLAKALGDGRLAIGDPAGVPAGIYAKAALEHLGVWNEVADKLAPMADVRAALTLVERGEVPAGIVYATDAAASRGVTVAGIFPDGTHPPIIYPAALLPGAGAAARDFYGFLRGPAARAIFERFGFEGM
jgi:cobalt-zinc-cadmium efflux system protein